MVCARAGGGPAWRSTVALAGLLCAGGTSWLVFIHHASGAHERGEPPLGVHMLRDAATALPPVLRGGVPALALGRALVRACKLPTGGAAAAAVAAVVAAVGASAALAAGIPLHAWLFQVREAHPQALPEHMIEDGGVALLVTLPLALLAFAISRRHALLARGRGRARVALAGVATVGLFGAGQWQVYADVVGGQALRDVISPCFNDSPVGPPFAANMPIPPLKRPNTGTPTAYTVVEKRSEAEIIPGIKTPVWSYDGTVPGPTFLVDKSEVKDTANPINVTFQNALPPADGGRPDRHYLQAAPLGRAPLRPVDDLGPPARHQRRPLLRRLCRQRRRAPSPGPARRAIHPRLPEQRLPAARHALGPRPLDPHHEPAHLPRPRGPVHRAGRQGEGAAAAQGLRRARHPAGPQGRNDRERADEVGAPGGARRAAAPGHADL